ncbi:hypothetical protein C0Q70_03076 [Pomacea canaliculata]|uniref:Uncharacterized protein n=1 Tax=Pomacea canaliculata TaxID=400727 RepID=A0A2T7PRQ0_POMCA|nr:uncharacterized protein LOC112558403 [Pomacea canaliculata]PVD36103.1 hypothetical protein C0Q70_03076 [Pomacea canaliculata]
MTTPVQPHPGFPAYYYGDSKAGSMSELSEVGMKRYGSQPSIGGHSLGSRSLLYGSRRSLYSTYTVSGMSYILPVMTKQPNPWRRPCDNWPIAFCSLFINPLFGVFAILLAEQSKIYYAKCDYVRASQYGVYAKGVAAGGIYSSFILLLWILGIVFWNAFRYYGW